MRRVSPLLLLSLILLLTGCMSLGGSQQPHAHTWQLKTPEESGLRGDPLDASILVGRVQAMPGYDTAALAYRESDHEIRYYSRNRWSDRPARQLQPILVEHLENRGVFRTALAGPASLSTDYRLEAELLHLELDLRQEPGQARLAMRVRLVDQSDQELLLSKTLRSRAEMRETNPEAGVAAANQALARLLEMLEAELVAALQQ